MSFTIGSDPELSFATIDGKNRLFIANGRLGATNSHNEDFGSDGNNGEIRAKESVNPLIHVNNIETVLRKYREKSSMAYSYAMFGYAPNWPVGGHIHIGKSGLSDESLLSAKIGLALDTYLALPFLFLENKNVSQGRRQRYGALSDIRPQDYGIEYRTLSSWLASKRLAQGVMTLAYTIIDDTLERGAKITKNNTTKYSGFNDLFIRHQTEILTPHMLQAAREVRQMALYPKYKEYIEYIFYNARKGNEITMGEMRHGWKIPYLTVRKEFKYTLLQLTKLMVQGIDNSRPTDYQKIFISSDHYEHFDIPHICRRLNNAINIILGDELNSNTVVKTLRIQGMKRSEGDTIKIYYHPNHVPQEKVMRMVRLMKDIMFSFDKKYGESFKIAVEESSVASNVTGGGESRMIIKIGREIRERQDYLAECIAFIGMIYLNDGIYKTYKRVKATGEDVDLHILSQSFIRGIQPLKKKLRKPHRVTNLDCEEEYSGMVSGFSLGTIYDLREGGSYSIPHPGNFERNDQLELINDENGEHINY